MAECTLHFWKRWGQNLQVVVLPEMPESADLALRADVFAVLRGQQQRVAQGLQALRTVSGQRALAPVDPGADCVVLITDDKEFGAELRQAQARASRTCLAAVGDLSF